jgi:hypothetical protein
MGVSSGWCGFSVIKVFGLEMSEERCGVTIGGADANDFKYA